ncbi:MAG: hypothetical protein ACJAWL_003485 [Motiliproteus sp.]|jgi:hypothetical protein
MMNRDMNPVMNPFIQECSIRAIYRFEIYRFEIYRFEIYRVVNLVSEST